MPSLEGDFDALKWNAIVRSSTRIFLYGETVECPVHPIRDPMADNLPSSRVLSDIIWRVVASFQILLFLPRIVREFRGLPRVAMMCGLHITRLRHALILVNLLDPFGLYSST